MLDPPHCLYCALLLRWLCSQMSDPPALARCLHQLLRLGLSCQMLDAPHCFHTLLMWLCSQIDEHLQSLRSLFLRLCWQMTLPLTTQHDRGQFHYRRAAFSSQLKSKVGSTLAKAAALRVNLNLDVSPITSRTHTHPSHSQTSCLLTSSLSLGVPVPRETHCMRGVQNPQL